MPRWARITRIERGAGPLATVELEIHYGNVPPFTYTDLVRASAGLIWVGQDVAVRRHRSGQHSSAGSDDGYEIRYGEPPHYGLRPRAKGRPAGRRRADSRRRTGGTAAPDGEAGQGKEGV
jgi:hypothetical protein